MIGEKACTGTWTSSFGGAMIGEKACTQAGSVAVIGGYTCG
jgi:hypothetical protein